jgi:hypothetical protein
MQQARSFKLILDGRRMIWKRSGHCSDALYEPILLQAQIDCKLFPIPKADISQTIFAADLHGQFRLLKVCRLVRQNARQIVERRESNRPIAA